MGNKTLAVFWGILLLAWTITGVCILLSGEITWIEYICAWLMGIIFEVYVLLEEISDRG